MDGTKRIFIGCAMERGPLLHYSRFRKMENALEASLKLSGHHQKRKSLRMTLLRCFLICQLDRISNAKTPKKLLHAGKIGDHILEMASSIHLSLSIK